MNRKLLKPETSDFLDSSLGSLTKSRVLGTHAYLLIDAMNFCSWPDENRPTKPRRSWKEALGSPLPLFSHSLGQTRKMGSFCPNFSFVLT